MLLRDIRRDLRGGQDDVAACVERVRDQLKSGAAKVEAGLRKGIRDGSVRPDIDIDRAVNDISAAVFGIAFRWTALTDQYDLGRELTKYPGADHRRLRRPNAPVIPLARPASGVSAQRPAGAPALASRCSRRWS